MSKSPKVKNSHITESELEKYLVYLEVGTQEEAAKKLDLKYASAISNALTSVDEKIRSSINTIKIALDHDMFSRLGANNRKLVHKLSYVFDETKEVITIPKKQYDDLQRVLDKIKEGTVADYIQLCVKEKIKKHIIARKEVKSP